MHSFQEYLPLRAVFRRTIFVGFNLFVSFEDIYAGLSRLVRLRNGFFCTLLL